MKILAIDTAMETCSIAIWNRGKIYLNFKKCLKEHNKYVFQLLKKTLNQSNTTLVEIDAIAFSRGPGNFTGLRVGISLAKGLALGINCPVIGISTLLSMAQNALRNTTETRILVAIDAKMGKLYWAKYIFSKKGIWYGKKSEAILKPEEINKQIKQLSGTWITIGSGWNIYPEIFQECRIELKNCNIISSSAEDILPIAYRLLKIGRTVSVAKAKPVYLADLIASKKS